MVRFSATKEWAQASLFRNAATGLGEIGVVAGVLRDVHEGARAHVQDASAAGGGARYCFDAEWRTGLGLNGKRL